VKTHAFLTQFIAVFILSVMPTGVALGQVPRHGIQEFNQSGTFEVPAGVSHIVVELWGAGGGGGGGASAGVGLGPNGGGGGGGSGAYIRASLAVVEGETYVITIGAAGRGGTGELKDVATEGANGGDSSIRSGQRIFLVAKGGQGGRAAAYSNVRGGRAGAGGIGTPAPWMIVRSGNQGSDGQMGGTPEGNSTPGGEGGPAIAGTFAPSSLFGGSGGTGGTFGDGGGRGADGGPGLAMIVW